HHLAPDRQRAEPEDHVAGDPERDGTQQHHRERDPRLVGQIAADQEARKAAPALRPADLGARARMRRDADAAFGRALAFLALLALLAFVGLGLVRGLALRLLLVAHQDLRSSELPRVFARSARWRSKMK